MRSRLRPGSSLGGPLFPLLAALGLLVSPLSPGCGGEGETIYESPLPAVDDDADGYTREDDCNDDEPSVYPGAPEDPNGGTAGDELDNDCDGQVDEGTQRGDDDLDGYSERDGDCDDENMVIHPGATDGCDEVDGDCDGLVDEDAADLQEPNNLRSAAIPLGTGPDNDLTCNFASVNINLISTTANAGSPDQDWFTFYVTASATTGCTYGVTATLKDVAAGETVSLRLYSASTTTVLVEDTFTSTSDTDVFVLQWVGPRNGSGAGDFYLQVTSPNISDVCRNSMRLVVQGLAPPQVEIPTP